MVPKQINTAAIGQRLVQLFSLKGRFQPVLDEVIVPVVSVDPESVERRPASGYLTQTGAAGELPYLCLFNPSTSNLIIRLTDVWVFASAAQACYAQVGFLARTNAGVTEWLDDRLPGLPAGDFGGGSTAVSIGAAATMRFVALASNAALQTIQPPVILAPGDGFLIQGGTVASSLFCTMQWTEEAITADGYR